MQRFHDVQADSFVDQERRKLMAQVMDTYPQSVIAFRNQVNAIASFDCTEALSGVAATTMVISGKEDLLFPTEVCTRLAQSIPGAAISVIDNAAHSIHMEQPRAFSECVLEFLRHH